MQDNGCKQSHHMPNVYQTLKAPRSVPMLPLTLREGTGGSRAHIDNTGIYETHDLINFSTFIYDDQFRFEHI